MPSEATVTAIKPGKIHTNTDREHAKRRAQDINERLGRVTDDVETLPVLIVEAWNDHDWETLGYETWEGYVAEEFGNLPRLTEVMRKHWTRQLKDESEPSMPVRAIAAVTGAHYSTASRDLREDAEPEAVAPATPKETALKSEPPPVDYWGDLATLALRWTQHHAETKPDPKQVRLLRTRLTKALKALEAWDDLGQEGK